LKKKLIVALSIVGALIGLIILLLFTLFSLRTIDVDFRTSQLNITATEEKIIEESGIKKGGTVFFRNKKKYAKSIEEISPYIKVVNIETVFPSKWIIHIAERQEVYAIPFEKGHYICDEEMRVLKIDTAYQNDASNSILLNLASPIQDNDVKEGEYLDIVVPQMYQAFFENNRTLGEQQEIIESITLSNELNKVTQKDEMVATLKLFSGQTVKIVNTEYGLVSKVKLMINVYSQLFEYIGKTLKTESGDVVLTEQHLKTCTIEINNYLHPEHGKNDCYFNIFIN